MSHMKLIFERESARQALFLSGDLPHAWYEPAYAV